MDERIATVVFSLGKKLSNSQKLEILSRVTGDIDADLFLFPGGYFSAGRKKSERIYNWVGEEVSRRAGNGVAVVGVDGRQGKPWARDQTAMAVSKDGIIGCARKFHAAPAEKGIVCLADNYFEGEGDFERTFNHRGKSHYLAACYDSFGVRHRNLTNPGVDAVLDCVHGFFPIGEKGCGESYFAKHGLAGASKQWGCPAFGSAVFFNRSIPDNWPSGVLWNSDYKITSYWRYSDNALSSESTKRIKVPSGEMKIDVYKI